MCLRITLGRVKVLASLASVRVKLNSHTWLTRKPVNSQDQGPPINRRLKSHFTLSYSNPYVCILCLVLVTNVRIWIRLESIEYLRVLLIVLWFFIYLFYSLHTIHGNSAPGNRSVYTRDPLTGTFKWYQSLCSCPLSKWYWFCWDLIFKTEFIKKSSTKTEKTLNSHKILFLNVRTVLTDLNRELSLETPQYWSL